MGADVVTPGAAFVPLIDRVGASSPQKIAVTGPDGTVTYAELSHRAARLGRRLRQAGVNPGDLVGLCVNRSVSLVVAALAIFEVGGVYVAIDPLYPDERIRWMLDDSGAVAVVSDESTAERLGTFGDRPSIVTRAGGELPEGDGLPEGAWWLEGGGARSNGDSPPGRCRPTDLAYVVYTSGSTGLPKGVTVEHSGLSNLVDWHRCAFGLTADDRCTQIASPGFDAAVWEIWQCLATGATLHVVPEDVRLDPVGLRDWLVATRITVTFLPTAVAEGLLGLAWPEETALRFLLTGGAALTRRPPAGLGFSVVNNYGLSETTVVATSGTVAPDGDRPPTIGTAITGATVDVVDEELRPIAAGDVGELVIGGVVVGRGYLNRPELTAERFLNGSQGRRYRTGDRVRIRDDGEIEFLGRLDDQLSIRGVRVEPGEIDAALNSHPAIRASVSVGVGRATEDRHLVAYVVPSGEVRPHRAELNVFLGRFLPEQLLPSRYVWLDELPLTAHGKIDRDALAANDTNAGRVERNDNEVGGDETNAGGRRSATEAAIAPVLTELLDVASIGSTENFFLLGGHSMLGAQLIVRLEKQFGVEITLRFLFDHPTLAEIAAEVDRQMAVGEVVGTSTG
jgi:amino acid adenylation domain-containing protein